MNSRQLDVAGAEHFGHRRLLSLLRLLVESGERLPLGERPGEIGLYAFDSAEKLYFHEDDGPGDHGEADQQEEDQLDDRAGEEYMVQYLGIEQACRGGKHR